MTPNKTPEKTILLPPTRQTVHIHIYEKEKEIEHLEFEGEIEMSQQQQDFYKSLIGDGMARITVSKELSEMSFGNGGKTMVSISLTCDQSGAAVNGAAVLADQLAVYYLSQHFDQMRGIVAQKGINGK